MYQVTIRKSVRHADGSTVVYEDPAQVNHERHAENLAARIARDPGVEWVEVEEVAGRFKAHASVAHDGVVHESLKAKRYTGRRRRSRRKVGYLWVVVAIALLYALAKFLLGR